MLESTSSTLHKIRPLCEVLPNLIVVGNVRKLLHRALFVHGACGWFFVCTWLFPFTALAAIVKQIDNQFDDYYNQNCSYN